MRKLATAAISFSLIIFAANYILSVKALLVLAILMLAAAFFLLAMKRKWLKGVIISLFAASFAVGIFTLNFFLTTKRADDMDGKTYLISCKLLDYPDVYDDYCRAEVKLCTDGLTHFKALLYDNSMAIADAVPGQYLSFEATVRSADTRYGDDYDHYNSRGIFLILNSKSEIKVSGSESALLSLPQRINRFLSERVMHIFPEDTAAFMKSLMLGDKTELYENLKLHKALTAAGLMHIVAVSGMHIAFVVDAICTMYGRGRKGSLLALIVVWLFAFVTGLSPSAVRAAIMQSFALMAPVLRRENDPITSLGAALTFILILNPYAAMSISLQLSFAATAGIMLLAPKLFNAVIDLIPSDVQSRFSPLVRTFSSSVAGMVFTVPLVAIHFGYISLYSVISNVLALAVVPWCFTGGYLAVLASFIPYGNIVASGVAWLARYIIAVSKLVASIPFALVYLENSWLKLWVCLCYMLFISFAIGKRKVIFKILIPLGLSVLSFFLIYGAVHYHYRSGKGYVTAINVGQGQCIAAFSDDKTILVDCGGINCLNNAGETANSYLRSCGRSYIDVLILTHLHADHANGVVRLMENMDVGMILMPTDNDDSNEQLHMILDAADETDIRYIDEDMNFVLGDFRVSLYEPAESGDKNERCLMTRISLGDYDMLITGDSDMDAEEELCEEQNLSGTELLIVGHHGSRYSTSEILLDELKGETAIISVGYNYYGHPTDETLERLTAYGYNILRTDQCGNIEIRIG